MKIIAKDYQASSVHSLSFCKSSKNDLHSEKCDIKTTLATNFKNIICTLDSLTNQKRLIFHSPSFLDETSENRYAMSTYAVKHGRCYTRRDVRTINYIILS